MEVTLAPAPPMTAVTAPTFACARPALKPSMYCLPYPASGPDCEYTRPTKTFAPACGAAACCGVLQPAARSATAVAAEIEKLAMISRLRTCALQCFARVT